MSDVPVYMVANLVTNEDPAEYRIYEKGFFAILKRHGGSVITFDDNPKHLEGSDPRSGRMIIFQFPSAAAAEAWFNDPEYQALSEHRRAGADTKSITMVPGMPPRK